MKYRNREKQRTRVRKTPGLILCITLMGLDDSAIYTTSQAAATRFGLSSGNKGNSLKRMQNSIDYFISSVELEPDRIFQGGKTLLPRACSYLTPQGIRYRGTRAWFGRSIKQHLSDQDRARGLLGMGLCQWLETRSPQNPGFSNAPILERELSRIKVNPLSDLLEALERQQQPQDPLALRLYDQLTNLDLTALIELHSWLGTGSVPGSEPRPRRGFSLIALTACFVVIALANFF